MSDRNSLPARERLAVTRYIFPLGLRGCQPLWLAMLIAVFGSLISWNVHAVDELGLYELDGDVVDDTLSDDGFLSAGWGGHQVISGRVDTNNDGVITTADDLRINGIWVYDGRADINDNGVVNTDDDALNAFDGYNVYNGFIDISGDNFAPNIPAGDDAVDMLNGTTSANAFKVFFNTDDTTTVNQGPADGGNNDITMFQGGATKDDLPITVHKSVLVVDGRIDVNDNGTVGTSDDGRLHDIDVIDGRFDIDGDGNPVVPDPDDNGEYMGVAIIKGYLDMDGDLDTAVPDAGDDGSIEIWDGGWEWSSNNIQGKNDIYNAWGGSYLYAGASVGPHLTNDFILVFGADVIPSSGASSLSFWFLQDGEVDFIDTQAGQSGNDFQWKGSNTIADLLLQTDVASTGNSDLNSSSRALIWNPNNSLCVGGTTPPDCPDNSTLNGDNSFPNLTLVRTGTSCERASGNRQQLCSLANQADYPQPPEWPYDHDNAGIVSDTHLRGHLVEGAINLSSLYRELNIPVPCFSKALVETRTTASVTGTLTDFSLSGFEACAFEVIKTGDEFAVFGDRVTFTIELRNTGLLPLSFVDISDPLIDGQSGAGTTRDALLAAGCAELAAQTSCSFQVTYQTSVSTPDPLINTVTATFGGSDGSTYSSNDDHVVHLVAGGSIGDRVWLDEDGNGLQDAGEDGLAGVTVTLRKTLAVIGGEIDLNGDGLVNQIDSGFIDNVHIIAGRVDIDNDGNIDADDDGTFQGFTVTDGIVTGTTSVLGATQTTVTDVNGEYVFTDLGPGEYDVSIDSTTDPALLGLDPTFDADGGLDNSTKVILGLNETNTSTDFGLNYVPPGSTDNPTAGATGAIGDRIWNDADGNGVQDEGEAGIDGVGVVLTYDSNGDGLVDSVYDATVTDASGSYVFDDLPPGVYQVVVIGDISDPSTLPVQGDPIPGAVAPGGFTATYDPDETAPCTVCDGTTTTPILLAPGDVYVNADFGYQDTNLPNVSGTLFYDTNVDGVDDADDFGIAGVTVSLAQEWSVVGGYLDLDGDGTGNDGDDDGIVDGVQVINGLLDLNGDGVVNGSDSGWFNGIAVVAGALDLDGDGAGAGDLDDVGTFNTIVASTTTDASGNYTFFDVEPGDYAVLVTDSANLLGDDQQTGDPDRGGLCVTCDAAGSITVAAAPVSGVDFGYTAGGHSDGEGLITGSVGLDSLNNDAVDPGEELAGITVDLVRLYDVIGGVIDLDNDTSVNADDSGAIVEDENDDGIYITHCIVDGLVDVNCDQSVIGNDVINGRLDANGDGLTNGSDDGFYEGYEIIDGYIDLNGDGAITDADDGSVFDESGSPVTVIDGWFDANGNGIDIGGIRDFPLDGGDDTELDGDDLDLAGTSGTVFDGYTIEDGVLLSSGSPANDTLEVAQDSAITDANGFYAFGGLDPQGKYRVQLDAGTYPPGLANDFDFDGGTADGIAIVNLYDPGNNSDVQNDVDFGLIGTNSLSGTVWEDLNADGSNGFDGTGATDGSPNETALGISGVTVELVAVYTAVNGVLDTNGDGIAGGAGDTGSIEGVAIINGALDINGDGVIDGDDDGTVQGVSVVNGQLDFDGDGTGGELNGEDDGRLLGDVVATTTTTNGDYSFTNLPDGTFEVKVTDDANLLNGYWLSDGVNDGDDNNSQVDPYEVSLNGGASDSTADFGYYIKDATVGNIVFSDTNQNGLQDGGEPGIEGIVVTLEVTYLGPNGVLGGGDDTVVTVSTITDSNGEYSFGNVLLDEDYNGVQVGDPSFELGVANTETQSYLVDNGLIDVDGNGTVDSNDDGLINGIWVIDGELDVDGDGIAGETNGDDDGALRGFNIVDGLLDMNADGTAGETNGDDDARLPSYLSTHTGPAATDDSLETLGSGLADLDADDPDGTAGYPVQGADDPTNDFGFVLSGSISGRAWSDDNGDGIEDTGEAGLVGLPVYLLDQDGNPVLDGGGTPVTTVTSDGTTDVDGDGSVDPAGSYYFGDLYPCTGACSYTVQFGTTVDIVNGLVDLDGDGVTGGDAGDTGTINGFDVIEGLLDINGDGTIDGNDDGSFGGYAVVDGVIDLDGDGTAGEVNGEDDGLVYAQPADHDVTGQDLGGNDTVDSDAENDPAAANYGAVTGIQVTPGATVSDVDAGYRPLGTIQGSVLADTGTTDNAVDNDDAGISGVIVDLYRDADNDGTLDAAEIAAGPVQTTSTDLDGSYEFEDVLIGNYLVVERQPGGFVTLLDESVLDGDDLVNGLATDDIIPVNLAAAGEIDAGNNFLEEINAVVAVSDDNNTIMNVAVSGDILFNDFDPQNKDADPGNDQTITLQPTFAVDTNGDGDLTDAGDVGNVGTALSVSGVDDNGTPVATAGELIVNADGTYTFTPADGFTGEVVVNYTICDDGTPQACDTATLRIVVSPYPDPQDAAGTNSTIANDDDNISYGNPVNDNLFVNDSDPEQDAFSVTGWTADTNGDGIQEDVSGSIGSTITVYGTNASGNTVVAGTLQVNADGSYTFTPCTDTNTPVADCDGLFEGEVLSGYTNTDGNASPATDSASLRITVAGEPDEAVSGLAPPPEVNDPPVANDDFVTANFEPSGTTVNVTGSWLGNDSDPNGDSLTLNHSFGALITTDAGGTITFNADGTYTYSPPTDYIGPDSVTYEICDDGTPQQCDVATIYMVVFPVLDFGDLQNNGAILPPPAVGAPKAAKFKTSGFAAGRHVILPGLRLGADIDGEPNGQPTDLADGDGADEDSTSLEGIRPDDTNVYRLGIEVTNNRDRDAIVTGWLDLNCDLDFEDEGERATGRMTTATMDAAGNPLANPSYSQTVSPISGWEGVVNQDVRGQVVAAGSGTQIVGLEWYIDGDALISQAAADQDCSVVDFAPRMFARIRVTSDRGTANGGSNRADSDFFSAASPTPNGPSRDGEIEDYELSLAASTTPVMIAEVNATAVTGGGAEIAWLTASELGAAAFRVERWVQTSDKSGHWVRAHNTPWVPALLALQGGWYQVYDADAQAGETYTYQIVEQASKGKQIEYGPYELTIEHGDAPLNTEGAGFARQESVDLNRVIALSDLRASNQTRPAPDNKAKASSTNVQVSGPVQGSGDARLAAPPVSTGSSHTLRMEIGKTGIYQIKAADLATYLDLTASKLKDQIKAGQFYMTTGGTDVSWYADSANNLYFYGESIDSHYSATRSYWLAAKGKGPQMGTVKVKGAAAVNAVFIDEADFEENTFAFLTSTDNPEDDYWFWNYLYAFDGYRTLTYPVALPDTREAAGSISLRLFGNANTTHQLRVKVNGVEVDGGPVIFSGAVAFETTVNVPAAAFAGGGDIANVELTLDNSPTGALSSVFLDGFKITYTRGYRAYQDGITYQTADATQVSGFSTGSIVTLDVTDAQQPKRVTGGDVVQAGNTWSYRAKLPLGEYASAGPAGLLSPVSVTVDTPSDLKSRNNQADYVVIASDELWAGAQALADYRSVDLQTMMVNIQDIYDEFSYGLPDPAAVRQFVAASREWKTVPRYVAIVGDGSFDYQDRLGLGYNIINPVLFGNAQGLHASDTLLGDPFFTGTPIVAVGRIPAKTVAEVQNYVLKLDAYENGNTLLKPGLLLTDKPDNGGNFKFSGKLIANETAGEQVVIDLEGSTRAAVRSAVFDRLQQGASLMNYVGHGGVDRISKQSLLVNSDADTGINNNAHTPPFVGLSCLINNYSVAGWDSLGERLVLRPDAGMIASWAASGESYNLEATQMGIRFNGIYPQHDRLGDAIIEALSGEALLKEVYTLLGDPALRIR